MMIEKKPKYYSPGLIKGYGKVTPIININDQKASNHQNISNEKREAVIQAAVEFGLFDKFEIGKNGSGYYERFGNKNKMPSCFSISWSDTGDLSEFWKRVDELAKQETENG